MLKLRRRTGMVAIVRLLTVVAVAVYYARRGPHLATRSATPTGISTTSSPCSRMAGSVAGVIVGATAGAADIEAGVFRDLVATGRSRLALFFARVPGAWAIVLPMLALAVALAAVLATLLTRPTTSSRGAAAGAHRPARSPRPSASASPR